MMAEDEFAAAAAAAAVAVAVAVAPLAGRREREATGRADVVVGVGGAEVEDTGI